MSNTNINSFPEGWRETTLGDVCDFVTKKINCSDVSIDKYISTENMLPYKGGVQLAATIPSNGKCSKFIIGDVLFSNIRTYFKKVWKASFEGGASNDVIVFRPKEEKEICKDYLYYVICNDSFIDYTILTAKGTKMPRGDKDAIRQYPLFLAAPDEQKAIAKVLSSFDNKIDLLQEQNKTLEAIAQTIFKEWFGKYQVGDELPEGWSVGTLGDEFDIVMGQSPKGETYNEQGKGMVFFQGRTDFKNRFPSIRLFTTAPKRIANKLDVLVSVRAPVGDINIAMVDCCIGRGLSAVRSEYKSYVLYKLKSLKDVFDLFESEGTVFGSINKTSFSNIEVVIPIVNKKVEFEERTSGLDVRIYENSCQIESLKKTRDQLLPELMNGKLRVKSIK